MHLLVSVRDASEAAAALAGGADIIDAKDPSAGALGAVPLSTFRAIRGVVGGARPVSAALGDAPDAAMAARLAATFSAAGATFVKVGFDAAADASAVAAIVRAAVAGTRAAAEPTFRSADDGVAEPTVRSAGNRADVVAAAYADRCGAVSPFALITIAATCGAAGVLLDTADKAGPGLCALWAPARITAWLQAASTAGLRAGVAGRVREDDLVHLRALGAAIIGVRGAACGGGRTSSIVTTKVRALKALAAGDGRSRRTELQLG